MILATSVTVVFFPRNLLKILLWWGEQNHYSNVAVVYFHNNIYMNLHFNLKASFTKT
jgi:hypothetical protein